MKKRHLPIRTAVLCALLILEHGFAFCQTEPGTLSFKLEKVRRLWFNIVPSGLEASLTYYAKPFAEGLDTKLFFMAGAGYEEKPFYRFTDGSLITQEEVLTIAESDPDLHTLKYRTPNAQWEWGIIQGITWNERIGGNGLETFLMIRECIDIHYIPEDWDISSYLLGPSSPFSDRDGVFYNSFFGGLIHNNVLKNGHKLQSGTYCEASAEWAPPWLANGLFGEADFTRLNLQGKLFVPVFDARPESGANILSGYAGTFLCLDKAFGDEIPLFVSQSIGGRKLKKALGGAVRGFEKRSIDADLKIAWNNEFRLNGPLMAGAAGEGILPIIFFYGDAGYYKGFSNAPEAARDDSGFLFSTGAGIAFDLFGAGQIRFTLDLPIYPERLDGKPVHLDADVGLQF
jgi:hypothetical protein